MKAQIQKFTEGGNHQANANSFSLISFLWDSLFFVMIGYFIISIIEATATAHKRKEMSESKSLQDKTK
jgi:hypothetical protein